MILSVPEVSSANIRLSDIAGEVLVDWLPLARELGLSDQDIADIKLDYKRLNDQALAVLNHWYRNRTTDDAGLSLFFDLCVCKENARRACLFI